MDSGKLTWTQQAGLTHAKIALIGVLAVVLAGVLYMQFGKNFTNRSAAESVAQPPDSLPSTDSESMPGRIADKAVASNDVVSKKTLTMESWQSADLATVVRYDPFALPASFPRPGTSELEQALAQSNAKTAVDASAQRAALEAERQRTQGEFDNMRTQGVQVIIKRGDQFVAIIGDEEVHVGDQIDGFTVIDIDADGVKVAKDLSP